MATPNGALTNSAPANGRSNSTFKLEDVIPEFAFLNQPQPPVNNGIYTAVVFGGDKNRPKPTKKNDPDEYIDGQKLNYASRVVFPYK